MARKRKIREDVEAEKYPAQHSVPGMPELDTRIAESAQMSWAVLIKFVYEGLAAVPKVRRYHKDR